jgi:hypothetical protein
MTQSAHPGQKGGKRERIIEKITIVIMFVESIFSTSPITSPIFKSATAKAIIEEVGKNGKKRNKKRSLTITSSHPAVMEAINDHQSRLVSRGGGAIC